MKREYGIDLLKMVAMLMVVAHHIVFWGGYGLSACQSGTKAVVLALFNAFCLFAVNCFILASGWVMCRKDFKIGRIVKLWCEVEFYSLLLLVIGWLFFPSITISRRDCIFTLLPLALNRYWFFTNYVGLFFLMPVLNAAITHLERRQLVCILVACFMLFSFHPFFLKNDMLHVFRGYSVFWFAYLYLLSGTISVHHLFDRIPTWMGFGGMIIGGVGSYIALEFSKWFSPKLGMTIDPGLFDAYNSPLILLGSLSMLFVFSRMSISKEWKQKAIAFIAPSVFSVYIIHSHGVFRRITNWNKYWPYFLEKHELGICMVTIVCASLLIFVGCIFVDATRRLAKHKVEQLIIRR